MHSQCKLLDVLELGRVFNEVFWGKLADLFHHGLSSIAGIWMRRKELRTPVAVFCLQFFEELCHSTRIVSGLIHQLGPHAVGFALGITRVLEENGTGAELDSKACQLADHPITCRYARDLQRYRRNGLFGSV